MTTYLLDVNVLLALSDPMHVHHDIAHNWFRNEGSYKWATCPITENGFVRVASHPSYPNRPGDAMFVLTLLRRFCASAGHEFWAEDVSIMNLITPNFALTHKQVTDVYLLGLAVSNGGKLATFDQRIPITAVSDAYHSLELLILNGQE
ncbi:MAG: VapC toxin family PIN domain ribonuclease [Chloroflexi bacterium]|nr:VapC toxin family PIN domain ribonuclease [Chloroflexota bacterium]